MGGDGRETPPPVGHRQGAVERSFAFLNTGFGTAITTVLVGGLIGQSITATVQDGTRERERLSALLKMRTEQAISMHRQFADDGMAGLKKAYQSAGAVLAATENAVLIASDPVFNPANYHEPDAARIRAQRSEIRKRFSEETDAWAKNRVEMGLTLSYYFGATNDTVATTWQVFDDALEAYIRCAYRTYTRGTDADSSCAQARTRARESLLEVSSVLRKNRSYLWMDWEKDLDHLSQIKPRPWWQLWAHSTS